MYGHSFECETYVENCVQLYGFSCEPKSFVGGLQFIKHVNLVPLWFVWVFM